ncbi:hypothetical protein F6X38_17775 [Aureimonas leprariae]|uniref:Uncharacterized protein n=1 Tax=Plantimonas leprariae TaxID=2615207 RepID=A0A7V7TVG0_9HYPH|nr:hypothetical protein F6X38_17775 [Aureimonas leprariae]
MGPCSPTPSGPAACLWLHQQAGQKTAPDQSAKASNPLLQQGSHPQRTSSVELSVRTTRSASVFLVVQEVALVTFACPLSARRVLAR